MIGILTEKPSAGRNFANALGGISGVYHGEPYQIVSARGHLYEFAKPEQQVPTGLADKYRVWNVENLPWNEKDFAWKRVKKADADSTLFTIKATLSACEEIVIATDVDPTGEGELLAWEILDELRLKPKKWSRMYFTDEAPKSIQDAFVNRKPIASMNTDMDYMKADYRSKFDFLTMQFTRVATACGNGKDVLRQGRLKSAMVLIVGDQLKAVSEYKKIPFYQNRFRDENGVVYTNADEPAFPARDQVPAIYKTSSVTVNSREMKKQAPPKLLDLAALSARLSQKGYKAQSVLTVYQRMYEAQTVSYPHTEDKVITPEQFNELLPKVDKIAGVIGVDKALLTHRQPRSTHVKTGGAHGANRPGPNVPASLAELVKYDTAKDGKGLAAEIYRILAANYLATLAEDYVYEAQKGHVTDYPAFKGSANVPKKAGWKAVFSPDDTNDGESALGLGARAEPFVYEGFPPKPTAPTMKWLMNQLEKHDVGTGATRTSIYADVTNDKSKFPLLMDKRGKLTMAPCGEMSYRLLPGTHIGDLKLTEQFQADMRDIAAGKADPAVCLSRVRQMVIDDIQVMEGNGMKMREALGVEQIGALDYATGRWHGKDIRFKRTWGTHRFSDAEVQSLLNGDEISIFGIASKKGDGTYNVKGHLEEDVYNGNPFVGFKQICYLNDDGTERLPVGNSSEYYTGKFGKAGEIRFKRIWGGHSFTDKECEALLAGKEISFDAVSSGGREYTARGKLALQEYKGKAYYGFKADFSDNHRTGGKTKKK